MCPESVGIYLDKSRNSVKAEYLEVLGDRAPISRNILLENNFGDEKLIILFSLPAVVIRAKPFLQGTLGKLSIGTRAKYYLAAHMSWFDDVRETRQDELVEVGLCSEDLYGLNNMLRSDPGADVHLQIFLVGYELPDGILERTVDFQSVQVVTVACIGAESRGPPVLVPETKPTVVSIRPSCRGCDVAKDCAQTHDQLARKFVNARKKGVGGLVVGGRERTNRKNQVASLRGMRTMPISPSKPDGVARLGEILKGFEWP